MAKKKEGPFKFAGWAGLGCPWAGGAGCQWPGGGGLGARTRRLAGPCGCFGHCRCSEAEGNLNLNVGIMPVIVAPAQRPGPVVGPSASDRSCAQSPARASLPT
jgi:hypothetical protein